MDIAISNTENEVAGLRYIYGNAEQIPLEDFSVDTVICTHVLEHVIDIRKAIDEIRRVARKRIIIIVPAQRSYLYTFDLHVRFFPYVHSFLLEMMPLVKENVICKKIGGDIYYQEDVQKPQACNSL
jgi:ubiquinone/menaquinone biosynthesis C-methylase UbiE